MKPFKPIVGVARINSKIAIVDDAAPIGLNPALENQLESLCVPRRSGKLALAALAMGAICGPMLLPMADVQPTLTDRQLEVEAETIAKAKAKRERRAAKRSNL